MEKAGVLYSLAYDIRMMPKQGYTPNGNFEYLQPVKSNRVLLQFIQKNEIDVIFLDINIPSLDGVLLAKNISKFSKKPYIVFITAYKEHAAEAFEIEVFDYILKPYYESRIISMSKKLEVTYNNAKDDSHYSFPSYSR